MDGSLRSRTEAPAAPTASVGRGRRRRRGVQRAGPSPDAQPRHRPAQDHRGELEGGSKGGGGVRRGQGFRLCHKGEDHICDASWELFKCCITDSLLNSSAKSIRCVQSVINVRNAPIMHYRCALPGTCQYVFVSVFSSDTNTAEVVCPAVQMLMVQTDKS